MNIFKLAGGVLLLTLGFFVSITSVQAVSNFELGPTNTTVRAGDIVKFVVTEVNGSIIDVTDQVIFTDDDPVGNFTQAIYHAGKVGTWTITATIDNTELATSVTVKPGKLATINIAPQNDPVVVTVGASQQFTATGYDTLKNAITLDKVVWTGAFSLGSINEAGIFTADNVGGSQIVAVAEDILGLTTIRVEPSAPVLDSETAETTPAAEATTDEVVTEEAVEASTDDEVVVAAAIVEEGDEACTSMSWWGWLLASLGFLAIIQIYYYFVRKQRSSLWLIIPAIVTVAAIWLYYWYRCENEFTWIFWIILIGVIIITILRPRSFNAEYGEEL
jgi:hypothetical protein